MIAFVSDKDMAKLYVQFFFDRNNPISEILKPCKKLTVVYYYFQIRLEFLNLIIHSCSFFKQNFIGNFNFIFVHSFSFKQSLIK